MSWIKELSESITKAREAYIRFEGAAEDSDQGAALVDLQTALFAATKTITMVENFDEWASKNGPKATDLNELKTRLLSTKELRINGMTFAEMAVSRHEWADRAFKAEEKLRQINELSK